MYDVSNRQLRNLKVSFSHEHLFKFSIGLFDIFCDLKTDTLFSRKDFLMSLILRENLT